MARFATKKTFDSEEGYLSMCSARTEIEKFLERKYRSAGRKLVRHHIAYISNLSKILAFFYIVVA